MKKPGWHRIFHPYSLGGLLLLMVVAAAGMVLAATPSIQFEAESGTFTGNASAATDVKASGGHAAQFGTAQTTSCTAQFCDNFENYTAGQTPNGPWAVSFNAEGAIKVDTVRAYSGSNSVHFTGESTVSPRLITTATLPSASNNVFGRFMLWQSRVPNRNHTNFIAGIGHLPNVSFDVVYNWGGHYGEYMSNYSVTDGFTMPGGMWPVGRWTCIEWQFDGSPNPAGGTMDELRIWEDGVLKGYVPTTGGTSATNGGGGRFIAPTKFERIEIGQTLVESYPLDYSIDDFALSGSRIGCPQ